MSRKTAWLLALLYAALAGCAGSPVNDAGRDDAGLSPDDATVTQALYAHYRQWQDVPYRYGGRDTGGIDCSSFARQALGAVAAVDLPRTTRAQATSGRRIGRAELAPGDLVFFRIGGKGRHVGVYAGNGRFMHASTTDGVTISRLADHYWRRHYWQSRRVFSDR